MASPQCRGGGRKDTTKPYGRSSCKGRELRGEEAGGPDPRTRSSPILAKSETLHPSPAEGRGGSRCPVRGTGRGTPPNNWMAGTRQMPLPTPMRLKC